MKRRHSLLNVLSPTSFITTTTVNFIPIFKNEALVVIVLNTMRACLEKYTIKIHAYVIMPNHLHILLTGEDQISVSRFTGKLKQYSARQIIDWCLHNDKENLLAAFSTAASNLKQGHKYQVWQKRFDNVILTRQKDIDTKLNYIHNNPLQEKWRLCQNIEDYRFSSARYYTTGESASIPISKTT